MTGLGRKDDTTEEQTSDGLTRTHGSSQSEAPNNVQEAFRILGLSPDASHEEVRAAYREALREKHPDKGGSREEFHELQEAKDTLQEYFGEGL